MMVRTDSKFVLWIAVAGVVSRARGSELAALFDSLRLKELVG